jgi:hypothetical protein
MAIKKIEFAAKNVKPFSAWLNRFSSIDNSLLLEIDESTSMFLAKTYNEERSVVKFSEIAFDEAGLLLKSKSESNGKRVKVGLYNISRLVKIMDQFGTDSFDLTFNYDEILGEVPELAGVTIVLKNKNLKITIDCTSLNIFKYITDVLFNTAIAKIENVVDTFDISKEDIEKINALSKLDSDYKYLAFSRNSGIYVSGKTFELLLPADSGVSTTSCIDVFKEQFEKIDIENYKVVMGEDRLVFKSTTSNTTTTVSMVEKD